MLSTGDTSGIVDVDVSGWEKSEPVISKARNIMNIKDAVMNIPGNVISIPGKVARQAVMAASTVAHTAMPQNGRKSISDEDFRLSVSEIEELLIKNARDRANLAVKVRYSTLPPGAVYIVSLPSSARQTRTLSLLLF
jgi:hypothetical protein